LNNYTNFMLYIVHCLRCICYIPLFNCWLCGDRSPY